MSLARLSLPRLSKLRHCCSVVPTENPKTRLGQPSHNHGSTVYLRSIMNVPLSATSNIGLA